MSSMSTLNFAIYYRVPDRAFERAADTWEAEASKAIGSGALFLKEGVSTEADVLAAWTRILDRATREGLPVYAGQIFSHASKGSRNDGLEFQPGEDEDGTIDRTGIQSMPVLPWDPQGTLTLTGCNTGLVGTRGWCPASDFATHQKVHTVGQAGYGYFSTQTRRYSRIDDSSTTVYLWAYRRGKNGAFGDGMRINGTLYDPKGRRII
jgi:hypothetical protein